MQTEGPHGHSIGTRTSFTAVHVSVQGTAPAPGSRNAETRIRQDLFLQSTRTSRSTASCSGNLSNVTRGPSIQLSTILPFSGARERERSGRRGRLSAMAGYMASASARLQHAVRLVAAKQMK